jgi:hypothetical protein
MLNPWDFGLFHIERGNLCALFTARPANLVTGLGSPFYLARFATELDVRRFFVIHDENTLYQPSDAMVRFR